MTYKNLIDNLEGIINSHLFIQTYGYGQLSDIAVPEGGEPPNYPYAFINPVDVSNGRNSFNCTLNLILMTQVNDGQDNELSGQDECMQYIQDIVSVFTNTNNDPLLDISTPFSMTPFKERFQDDVVGATATLTINYAKAIDGCDTPFSSLPTIPTASCPQVLVTDGDESEHWVDAGETYSCLPATPKAGITYQRVIPWEGFDTSAVVGSVEWHRAQGTYDYTAPTNPESVALKKNRYFGSDGESLLYFNNRFGNNYRYTNDIGQQYTEGFDEDAGNHSDNPRLCIDHLTGLAIYVWAAYDTQNFTWDDSIVYANNFSYAGNSDWRCADIAEFLAIMDMSDWSNAWGAAYTPWMNPNVRNYGGTYVFGCRDNDGSYLSTKTNSTTISRTTNAATTYGHNLMVTNYFI